MKIGDSAMPWGYFTINPHYTGDDFRQGVGANHTSNININETYCLVGVEPHTMFRPGTEPKGFRWFWWDNSMLPHLRHHSPSNPTGNKLWSRLTYCGWSIPSSWQGRQSDRDRVNEILKQNSGGVIRDISELWHGTRSSSSLTNRKCLVIRSSERNYKEFYNCTWDDYWQRIKPVLDRHKFTYEVRKKVSPKSRHGNQITDQIKNGGFDCVLANHSAGASEAVVTGTPVITTSEMNPARRVSTPWEHFVEHGDVIPQTQTKIEDWVTAVCGYTYFRTELDTLSWIDVHPQAEKLKEQKYAVYKNI